MSSPFNLNQETMAKLKEAQMNIWKLREGPNGEQPPAEIDDTFVWKHRQLETVQVDKVEVGPDQRDERVTLVRVQLRGVDAPNQNRVHTQWIRLYPPYEDSGNLSRNTLAAMGLIGQLLDAAGFDEDAKATDLLGNAAAVPEGTKVVGLVELFCKPKRSGELFVGMDFTEFHPAA